MNGLPKGLYLQQQEIEILKCIQVANGEQYVESDGVDRILDEIYKKGQSDKAEEIRHTLRIGI